MPNQEISFVLVDGDWNHLTDVEGAVFRFDTLEEAKNHIDTASLATDIPEDQIVILKETREEVKR